MTRTATDIANMTADFLDSDPIGNLDTDRSGLGRAMRRNYEESAKTVIREFPWNCVTTRATLPALEIPAASTPDPTDHQYLFALPSNSLGIIELNGRPITEVTHTIESLAVYDNDGLEISRRPVLWANISGPIVAKFKALISPADMDPHLAKAIAIELGMRCVMKAANSAQKMALLQDLYTETTRGDIGRVGGHQTSSRENNAKLPTTYVSRSEKYRAGAID